MTRKPLDIHNETVV